MRALATTSLEIAGLGTVCAGMWLIWLPLGLICAGLSALLVGWRLA